METENKNPKEIQQEIFDQISKGADPVELKELLRKKGVPVEGYYFVSEAAHKRQIETPPQYGVSQQAGGGASAWQIFVAILSVVLLIFRIARCSSRHNY